MNKVVMSLVLLVSIQGGVLAMERSPISVGTPPSESQFGINPSWSSSSDEMASQSSADENCSDSDSSEGKEQVRPKLRRCAQGGVVQALVRSAVHVALPIGTSCADSTSTEDTTVAVTDKASAEKAVVALANLQVTNPEAEPKK